MASYTPKSRLARAFRRTLAGQYATPPVDSILHRSRTPKVPVSAQNYRQLVSKDQTCLRNPKPKQLHDATTPLMKFSHQIRSHAWRANGVHTDTIIVGRHYDDTRFDSSESLARRGYARYHRLKLSAVFILLGPLLYVLAASYIPFADDFLRASANASVFQSSPSPRPVSEYEHPLWWVLAVRQYAFGNDVLQGRASAENAYRRAINQIRSERDYHRKALYVWDAALLTNYAWFLLEKYNDPQAAGQIAQDAIKTLYDQAIQHEKAERERARSQALWTSLALNAVNIYLQYQAAKVNPQHLQTALFQPIWIEGDPDLRRVPTLQKYPGQIGEDIFRFSIIPEPLSGFFSSIGRIKMNHGGYCTGSVVGARLILTNAHCAKPENPPKYFQFERVHATQQWHVDTWFNYRGERLGWSQEVDGFENDWAILVLATPVDSSPLRLRARMPTTIRAGLNGNIVIAGYSSDVNNGLFLTVDWGCSNDDLASGENTVLLRHNCRTWKGSSGSPMIDRRSGMIVGVNAFVVGDVPCLGRDQCRGGGPTADEFAREIARLSRVYQ